MLITFLTYPANARFTTYPTLSISFSCDHYSLILKHPIHDTGFLLLQSFLFSLYEYLSNIKILDKEGIQSLPVKITPNGI
jgi:hypothetical protein